MANYRDSQGAALRSCVASCVLLAVFAVVTLADIYPQCGIVPDDTRVPATGEMKALIVFARFKDDNIRSWNNGWPMDPTKTSKDALPVWADSLVEDVSPPAFPSIEGSVTHRLHYASRGNLRFNGAVYESVVVLDSMATYKATYSGDDLEASRAAARDVLDSLDSWGYDFSDHVNVSSADTLDYFAICFRGVRTFKRSDCLPPTPCNSDSVVVLDLALNRCCNSGADPECASHGGIAFWMSHTFAGGYKIVPGRTTAMFGQNDRALWVDYDNIGSQPGTEPYNSSFYDCPVQTQSLRIFHQEFLHEISHSMLLGTTQIALTDSIGRQGTGLSNWGGSFGLTNLHSIAAIELGWLHPDTVRVGQDTTFLIRDTFLNGGPEFLSDDSTCVMIQTQDSTSTPQFFLLENRRRSTVYTDPWNIGVNWNRDIAPGSGLLITHMNYGGLPTIVHSDSTNRTLQVEVASGTWDSDYEPDPDGRSSITNWDVPYPAHNHTVPGERTILPASPTDVYGEHSSAQFTPYTTPNTNLYNFDTFESTGDTTQAIPSGLSILNIRTNSDSSMTFDIKWNQPSNATAGNAAWRGLMMLTDDFTVSSGDTLEIYNDARVLFRGAGPLTESQGVDENRIELLVDGHLRMVEDAGIATRSALGSSRDTSIRIGSYADSSGAGAGSADWYGLRLPGVDHLTIEKGSRITNARAALAMEDDQFPALGDLAQPWNLTPPTTLIDLANNRTMISFDRDIVIASSDSVTIPLSWIIGFAAQRDESGLNDPDLAELIVEGMLKADAYLGSEITFRSDRASNPTDDPHWGGITFDLPANFNAGYGFYDCVEPQSVLDDVIFRDADYSIKLKGMCAPTLTDITFEQSKFGDIYIDGTDVVIPREYDLTGTPTVSTLGIWDLTGPASIVTTPKSPTNNDAAFGADSLVDIIVQGRMRTRAGASSVSFAPIVTSADSAHWGGIYVDWHAQGTDIEGAKVGNARRGIYLFYPDSVRVAHNEVYDFEDFGISAKAELAGAVIDSNVVYRDQMAGEDTGKVGILVTESRVGTIRGNMIQCLFSEETQNGVGLLVANTETWCTAISGELFELLIEGNSSYGPGAIGSTVPWIGMRFDWPCGLDDQDVTIINNVSSDWYHPGGTGVLFNQGSDVQFTQNTVVNNWISVDNTGSKQAGPPGIRFKKNFLASGIDGASRVLRTDNADFLRLGADTSTTGRNFLATGGDSTSVFRFALENQDTSATTLHAENNEWSWSYGSADSAAVYNWLLVGNKPTVEFTPLIGAAISPNYAPPGCTEARVPLMPLPVPNAEAISERLDDGITLLSNGGTIVAYEVRAPYPSPGGGRITIEFTIAPKHSDHVRVDVFDVAGRRVRLLVEQSLPRGRYRASWDGRNESRSVVAAGTYFVRVQAGSFQKVEKVVVVR